jgi:hypothetical protein
MDFTNAPDKTMRCDHCGDAQARYQQTCCGAADFVEELDCPDCGQEVQTISTTAGGMLCHAKACNNCAWTGDPE